MKKSIYLFFLLSLFGIVFNIIRYFPDDKLHIFFCDVGQGDAIYIRFPNRSDMLIDGGPPNKRVIDCLSRIMPFYDRQIDVVLLTHPQADHMGGLTDVIKRYGVTYFITLPVGNTSQSYQQLVSLLSDKQVKVKNLYNGHKLKFGSVVIDILWPEHEWTREKMQNAKCKMQNGICFAGGEQEIAYTIDVFSNMIGQGTVLGAQTSEDLNYFSVVAHLSYDKFDALFTGDIDETVQRIMQSLAISIEADSDDPIEVFKVPHHGSRSGIVDELLDNIFAKMAVISVGKNNRYGHPAPEIIDRLKKRGITIFRTDEDGMIEVITDGQSWQVR